MHWSLDPAQHAAYIAGQINAFFPDPWPVAAHEIATLLPEARSRLETCFRSIRLKYYCEDGVPRYNHLHSDHHAAFLYILSNTAFRQTGHGRLAEKLFFLNKALHGLDAFYAIELPPVFLFVHPLGTVLGNAKYGNHFAVYQGCTIGATSDGTYPTFGDGVLLYSGASVIGATTTGDDVVFGANSFVLAGTIPSHSVVVGAHPVCRIIPGRTSVTELLFQ